MDLTKLLKPKSVAVVGASEKMDLEAMSAEILLHILRI